MKTIMFAVPTVALQAGPAPFTWFKETPTGRVWVLHREGQAHLSVPTLTFSPEFNQQKCSCMMLIKAYTRLISIVKSTVYHVSQGLKKTALPKDILMNHV